MEKAQIDRWSEAVTLLDQVLDVEPELRLQKAQELGTTHGVLIELTSLLAGTQDSSLLDDSLETLVQQLPEAGPEIDQFSGQIIGQWELGREMGRGGMSVVYHADRSGQEFEQHAALKILSVGHLGENFIASFQRERQILSDLHHPGIARLIDGGITPDGAPYLVMQYVNGQRIDQWCAERRADIPSITKLMIRLCDAVAYQQRHLVVHQDINPANVLVNEHDRPVLIDFGIATLMGPASEEKALRVFTPSYAAPEQKSGSSITTATDVYALGKLFETLASGLPLDSELQSILLKATDDDPDQRYANARQLQNEFLAWKEKRPLLAQPPTLVYRTERFITRNRWAVLAACMVMISVLGGLGVSIWQARIAAAERDTAQLESARAEQVTTFLKNLFLASDPDRAQGEIVTARELLDQGAHQVQTAFEGTPLLKAEMLLLLGNLYRELGELEAAASVLEEATSLTKSAPEPALHAEALLGLALTRMEQGQHEEALALAEQAESILEPLGHVPGRLHSVLMQAILFSLTESGEVAQAVERGLPVLDRARSVPDLPPEVLFNYIYHTANALLVARQTDEAEQLLLEAAAMSFEAAELPTHQIALHSDLATLYSRQGQLEAALEHDQQAVDLAMRIYPPVHSGRARRLNNLASTLSTLGRHEEAERAAKQALAIYEQIYPDSGHPRVGAAHNNLGMMLRRAGEIEAAEPHLEKATEMAAIHFGEDDPRYAVALGNLGDLKRRLGKLEEAERLLEKTLERRRAIFGEQHMYVGAGMALMCSLRLDQARYAEALSLSSNALDIFDALDYQGARILVAVMTRKARALAGLERNDEARTTFEETFQLADAEGSNAGTSRDELESAWKAFNASVANSTPSPADP